MGIITFLRVSFRQHLLAAAARAQCAARTAVFAQINEVHIVDIQPRRDGEHADSPPQSNRQQRKMVSIQKKKRKIVIRMIRLTN